MYLDLKNMYANNKRESKQREIKTNSIDTKM